MSLHLTNAQARHTILHLQGLTRPPHRAFPPGGLYKLIRQLGFVQIDSIQWVERAQHMTLFARNQTYRPRDLARLIEKEQLLFEHWTHDSSIIPSEFYPYWRHRFARERERLDKRFENWQGGGFRDHVGAMMERIERDGPLMSRDLERAEKGPQEMWQWHDGKAALEYLWHTGDLGITARKGFQKVYDKARNTIPDEHFEQRVSHDAFVDWACREALERLGFGTPGDIARYFDLIKPAEAKAWMEDQLASGANNTLQEVSIGCAKKDETREMVARADIGSIVEDLPPLPKRMRALSPFDPVIRDRKRLEWLFGFFYRIEIYVPAHKRVWGYYVFPLLENDRLVGRIDMCANKKADALQIRKIWWEDGIKLSDARRARLDAELIRQSRLSGVSKIEWL
ncbi:winged helix-turn-helix domain-containing protein [Pseudahrensia aquimaris]|uniref:Winged helix-turn-helix domain-containing protein n=1 Tax=Pseudahrensia aquimaris TaxID=744461 RepID=A0ABW3FG83_9HYPH